MFETLSAAELLVCAAVAGWLAALAIEGYGLGLVGNVVLGAGGAALAALCSSALGVVVDDRTVWVLAAMVGSMAVLSVMSFLRRR